MEILTTRLDRVASGRWYANISICSAVGCRPAVWDRGEIISSIKIHTFWLFILWVYGKKTSVCLCVNPHLYGLYRAAEELFQNRQVVSVHGGNLSLLIYGGESKKSDRGHEFKKALNRNLFNNLETFPTPFPVLHLNTTSGIETDLPARPAICRACDVLMVSICFSPFSLTLGFIRLLKMIRLILLEKEEKKGGPKDNQYSYCHLLDSQINCCCSFLVK